MQGENLEEKKKERKREIRKHSSLKHFSAVSCTGSRSLFLYSSVSLSLHGFLHHLSGLLSVSPALCPQICIYYHCPPPKSFSAFLPSSVPFSFSVSLHLSSVLLSLSLSLFLSFYLSACLLYHLSFLSFSNSPFISLSSVWLSISMSVSPFSCTGIKKSCDTSGLASVY